MQMYTPNPKRQWSRDHKSERHIQRAHDQQHSKTNPNVDQSLLNANQEMVLHWDLGGAEDALDCFLAAQTLGIQQGIGVLIFLNVDVDVLVSCVRGVRAPYKSVSVNTEYERGHQPEAYQNARGYLVLYHESLFRVSRWPRFYQPELFLTDNAPGRPPFFLQLKRRDGQLLDVFAWMGQSDIEQGLSRFLDSYAKRNHQGVLCLGASVGTCQQDHWKMVNAEATLLSTNAQARLSCVPGLRALTTQTNHSAQVIELKGGQQ